MNSTTLIFLNCLYPALASVAMIMLAHKLKSAFIIFLFVEVIMFYLGFVSGQFGVSLMAVVYFFTNIYAYYKWSV